MPLQEARNNTGAWLVVGLLGKNQPRAINGDRFALDRHPLLANQNLFFCLLDSLAFKRHLQVGWEFHVAYIGNPIADFLHIELGMAVEAAIKRGISI
jgi:hypothetical protein